MALASGTRVSLSYQEETTTRGVPEAVPDMQALRATSRAINLQKNTIRSAEVRSDRQVATLRHGFNQVVGSPGFELSLQAYDDFIEAALSGTWAAVATAASQTISITPGGLFTRGAGSFVTDGFHIGMIVTPSGYAAAENNLPGVVTDMATDGTTMTIVALGTAYSSEAGGGDESIAADGNIVQMGTTLRTYTIERAFEDITQYQVFNGCAINQMSMQVQPEAMIGGTFDILGMSADPMVQVPRDATVTAAATNDPMNSFDGALYEAGALNAVVTGVNFTLNNNRSLESVVGSKFSPDVFEGTGTITGELTAFFEDEGMFNRFVNETITGLTIKLDDLNGTDFIVLGFPAIKYTGGDMDPPQQGPVPIRMPFEAQVSAITGTSFFVQRSNT